ncbi:FIST signal transduction protein [Flavimarina sp. Hel_I_48]|uniref:FIST signal transduction protein n=1 Tax=Flavimarina sp. Hel_I_48 TaxID=1392488 RepID=UPI0004DFA514|nr:FIST N-terminal domain-containing protein [Flavimarina sp. Hel_I_48]
MKVIQATYSSESWEYSSVKEKLTNPLVLIFGDRFLLENTTTIEKIKEEFPYENLVFGSTAGEILGKKISEDSIVVTAVQFDNSSFEIKTANIKEYDKDAIELGKHLISELSQDDLKHVFILSEGSFVNGSDLLEGLESGENNFCVTGGLCGDGPRFEKTLTGLNKAEEGEVVVIGFYGENLEFSYASYGGWIPFGPERLVTKAEKNILYELDGQPALDLYSKYLGEKASELPQASLFYSLYLREEGKENRIVRTILNIDRDQKSMILAGNMVQGSRVQLMMASTDALLQGASEAAQLAVKNRKKKSQLALLVSCVGRKLVLDQRAEEEIEEVINIIGEDLSITGFYSYGEIAPFYGEHASSLHNQTMTLTLISE